MKAYGTLADGTIEGGNQLGRDVAIHEAHIRKISNSG
jgi:hypothetical protein